MIQFEWDTEKDILNQEKHGVRLVVGASVFLDNHRLINIDKRKDYQEIRYQTIGQIEGRLFVVIYTVRNDVIRLISVRKANKREKKYYDNR